MAVNISIANADLWETRDENTYTTVVNNLTFKTFSLFGFLGLNDRHMEKSSM